MKCLHTQRHREEGKRELRIDLVITELDDGGAERCCAELAIYLQGKDHHVRLIVLGPMPKPPRNELHGRLVQAGVGIEFIGAEKWYQFPTALWRLRRLVTKTPPEIAQSFLWHANVLCAAAYPRFNIPLVGGHRVAEQRTSRNRWSRWAVTKMHQVVCVSNSLAKWCSKAEGIPPEKLVVIPNGIDLEKVAVEAELPNELRKQPALLFVGRLHLQKGIDILMDNAESILAALPRHHLILIGYGAFRPVIDSWIKDFPYRDRVHVLGQRADVAAWIKQSQLLILPSRFEGMPNAVLEAMACGIPVATLQVEGISELLGELAPAQSVARDDWHAWRELVIHLGNTPDHCRELGKMNQARVREHFQLDSQLKRYEDLYLGILKNE
jgi:glycosyltransferase involved in cell wall biosynthesis